MRVADLVPMGEYGCCLGGPLTVVAALGLTALSLVFHRPWSPTVPNIPCAGFPVAFICDSGGGSPLVGLGTLGWEDLINGLDVIGLATNVLCYAVLIWMAWVIGYHTYVWANERR